jgi:hypothetical protein
VKVCGRCYNNHQKLTENNKVVSYWLNDNNEKMINVPEELSILPLAEKNLIALTSAHMCLVHLKNGSFGSREHICAVAQDLSEMCMILPRCLAGLNFIVILRRGRTKKS